MSCEVAPRRADRVGPGFFHLGIAGLILCGLEATYGLPGFPRFWYQHQPIWWLLSLVSLAAGFTAMSRSVAPQRLMWRPSVPGKRFRECIVYTAPGCTLCDETVALISRYRRWLPNPVEVSIETDPRLVAQFRKTVPVVALDGKVRFRGALCETLLRRLIEGSPVVDT